MNRRQFFKAAAGAVAVLAYRRAAYAWGRSPQLTKFPAGHLLPGWNLNSLASDLGIAHAENDGALSSLGNGVQTWNALHYRIEIGQFEQRLHPELGGDTPIWGYHQSEGRHLGPLFVVDRGTPVQITFTNKLPSTHVLPVDTSVPGAKQAVNRAAVHLHGGYIPWISDGGPYDWWTPEGTTGDLFYNNEVLNPTAAPGEAVYYYPNEESARLLWYHDHAVGITRLNAQAGMAGGYLIRERDKEKNAGLPIAELGESEYPLIIQDKVFNEDGTQWYPDLYDTNIWPLSRKGMGLPAGVSAVPEFFGDTVLANGLAYPTLPVPAGRCRFRILNACNTRVVNLQLWKRDGSADGITLNPATGIPTNTPGPVITQIGTEGGFLKTPVILNNPPLMSNPLTSTGNLLLAPAERADVLIDFSGVAAGTEFIVYNDAPVPFPMGDPAFDFYPGNPLNAAPTTAGFGPDTRQILKIVVGGDNVATPPARALNLATIGPEDPDGILISWPVKGAFKQIPVRDLTLNEGFDQYGRLSPTIGTAVPNGKGTFGLALTDPPTEVVRDGATEIWRIFNLTADTHPIHFHLVNVQIISRQPFQVAGFKGVPNFTGVARLPEPNELGWKETIRANPGECISVLVKFKLVPGLPFTVPLSPRTGGHEYVYHCHILEHEDHDMMRPLIVMP